jgi:argininosuccinate lyase
VFAAVEDVIGAIEAAGLLVKHLDFDRDRLAAAASDPSLLATDVAELQVQAGVPFRKAHAAVGRSVRDGTFKAPWSVAASLRHRDLPGAPHPRRVSARARVVSREAKALARWAKTHPPDLPI